jgi:hypothetical protein
LTSGNNLAFQLAAEKTDGYVRAMRTGLGSRVFLLLMVAVGLLVASMGFMGLAVEQGLHKEFALGLAIGGTLFVVVGLATYLLLAELQAQTAAALGSKTRQPRAPAHDLPAPTSKGNDLRVGRGDSWS